MFLTFSEAMGRILADRDVVVVAGPDLSQQVGQVRVGLPQLGSLLLLKGSRQIQRDKEKLFQRNFSLEPGLCT